MSGSFSIVAHIMGMPVEETVLFGLPPVTAAFGAWWTERRARRSVRAERRADAGDQGDEESGGDQQGA